MVSRPITEEIPIRTDEHGRMRIGGTNVLLDVVIYSFQLGSTPETITEQYPSLSLDDVYLAIGYYLRHRDQVDAYLSMEKTQAEAFEQELRQSQTSTLTREMLLERLKKSPRE